jgi:hypothetical protein
MGGLYISDLGAICNHHSMQYLDKRIIGLFISTTLGLIMLFGDDIYGWLALMFSYFVGLFSVGLMISAIFLGRKALQWGLIGILPLVIFLGVSALQRLFH